MVLAYGGLATATYWVGIEFGLRRWTAALAGMLTALAYPVLSAIFLWGWFTSLLALPLGLVALLLLERSLRTGRRRYAAWGGGCMALCILVHHMTGLSLGLGMAGWFAFHAVSGVYPRRQVAVFSAVFVAVTVLLVLPWGIPFMMHILDVGFRREVPGLWPGPDIATYRTNIIDTSTIGDFVYPSYLGLTLVVLSIGGTVYALLERRRQAGLAVALLVLLWFSMGADLNPLIRVYPFSGLDVARFHLYMVPLMAVFASLFVERILAFLKELWSNVSSRIPWDRRQYTWYIIAMVIVAAILVFPIMDARKARGFMGPYQVKGTVSEAINWLGDRSQPDGASEGSVYAVGLWTWHAFLIPYLADVRLVDGWHDEGASNVRQIRELRLMGWTGDVDIGRAHHILSELGAGYLLVNRISDIQGEPSKVFWDAVEAHPQWFEKEKQWGDVAVFRLIRES